MEWRVFLIKTVRLRVIGLTKENVSKPKFLMPSFCHRGLLLLEKNMIIVHETKQGRTL